ncbi:hypothetical protein GWI33_017758 [Rhynchophorus ferrugineus]|uniref:Uncharacterized protein n=1 Tax=Rhynchophorus ferrugineus TaxID=354439 RepID=A0A834HYM5_RHYFE|nr:hypothetical protein GWI33_017758 [Rhynchophorus ferrugineus]
METVNGSSLGVEDKGGPPPPSPLTGCYLLVVVGEPHSQEHKDIILQRIAKDSSVAPPPVHYHRLSTTEIIIDYDL